MEDERKSPMAQEKAKEEVSKKGPKFVRCFTVNGRGRVLLQDADSRKSKGNGFLLRFVACEGYCPAEFLHLLKANRRYGIKYLTEDDFYKLAEEDPRAAERFDNEMRDWCRARKIESPVIQKRYVEAR